MGKRVGNERVEDGATASQQVVIDNLQSPMAVLKLPEVVVPAKLHMFGHQNSTFSRVIKRELIWTLYGWDGQIILDHVLGPEVETMVLPGRYRRNWITSPATKK